MTPSLHIVVLLDIIVAASQASRALSYLVRLWLSGRKNCSENVTEMVVSVGVAGLLLVNLLLLNSLAK